MSLFKQFSAGVAALLNISAEEVQDMTDVEIAQAIDDAAAERAVENTVSTEVNATTDVVSSTTDESVETVYHTETKEDSKVTTFEAIESRLAAAEGRVSEMELELESLTNTLTQLNALNLSDLKSDVEKMVNLVSRLSVSSKTPSTTSKTPDAVQALNDAVKEVEEKTKATELSLDEFGARIF